MLIFTILIQVWSVIGKEQVQVFINRQLGALNQNICNERNKKNVLRGKSANDKKVQIYAINLGSIVLINIYGRIGTLVLYSI